MTDETSTVRFVVTSSQHEGRSGYNVTSTFEGLRNREHHRHVLTCIAVNAIRQLGLIDGMEAALEKVCRLAYGTKIETPPRIEYADGLKDSAERDEDR